MVANQEKTPPELIFAMDQFAEYYAHHDIDNVPGLQSREFGFMFFNKGFVHRHVGFPRREELQRYVAERAPSHAYYSSAYFERPGAKTMAEKGWLGADLIFDLDADHVKGSEGLPYDQMLLRVKEELIRLYDRFICSDLGFTEDQTEIVFSGGRGYHVHVYADSVKKLGSHERREIVDYITGTDLDLNLLLSSTIVEESERGKPMRSTRLPMVTDGGWYGKARNGLNAFLGQLEAMPREQVIELLTAEGMKKTQASRIHNVLFEQGRMERMLNEGILELLTDRDEDMKSLMSIVEKKVIRTEGGQTDEPVTSDIHRLIRLPGSLHGKTSLRVVSLSRDELTHFDPLRDAVAEFGEGAVTVYSTKTFTPESLGGESVQIKEGVNEIPVRLALFLILRRQVTLNPGRDDNTQRSSP